MHTLPPRRWYLPLYGLLSLFFCWPMFQQPNALGILDWDQHLFYYASVLKNIVEYGQMPFWNPWYCGGNVLWQNPQIPLLTPVFPLVAVVSLPMAMKINIALHYFVGLVGMHLLLTEGLGLVFLPLVAYLSGLVVFSGAMALHLAVGHSVFLPCLYLPLQLHFALRGIRQGRFRDLAAAGGLLALMIYNGALHVVPMSIGALGCFGLCVSASRKDWRPLAATIVLVGLGCAYAAPKLLPVTLWVNSDRFVDARTVLDRPDAMTADAVLRAYLDRYQTRGFRFDHQRSGWYEYGNYIGGVGTLLIAGGLIWPFVARGSRHRWLGLSLAITATLLLLLSAGEFSSWAPASLANHLPLFSSFRIPSRYTIAFVLFGATAAAWMLRDIGVNQLGAAPRTALSILCILALGDLTFQNREQIAGTFTLKAMEQPSFSIRGGPHVLVTDTTTNAYGPDSPMLTVLMRGQSFWNCYESLQTARVSSPDEPLVQASGTGRVSDISFSPNRIEFTATGGAVLSEVSLNQNFTAGWSSSLGAVTPSADRQRPSARLGPGQTGRFAFTFTPPGLWAGLAIMLVALATTVLVARFTVLGTERIAQREKA